MALLHCGMVTVRCRFGGAAKLILSVTFRMRPKQDPLRHRCRHYPWSATVPAALMHRAARSLTGIDL